VEKVLRFSTLLSFFLKVLLSTLIKLLRRMFSYDYVVERCESVAVNFF